MSWQLVALILGLGVEFIAFCAVIGKYGRKEGGEG
jgi:hypothetical protein